MVEINVHTIHMSGMCVGRFNATKQIIIIIYVAPENGQKCHLKLVTKM